MYGRAKVLDALGDTDGALDAWNRYREIAIGMEKERIFVQEAEQRIEYLRGVAALGLEAGPDFVGTEMKFYGAFLKIP